MSKHLKIGDIVEIPLTDGGFGYAQYTRKHKMYGALLRVLQVREKVEDIASLSGALHQFTTFFPLHAAINRQIVDVYPIVMDRGNKSIRGCLEKVCATLRYSLRDDEIMNVVHWR